MIKRTLIRYPIIQKNHGGSYCSFRKKLLPVGIEEVIQGGFKNQLQQLMFSSDFSELYIMQELSVNLYR